MCYETRFENDDYVYDEARSFRFSPCRLFLPPPLTSHGQGRTAPPPVVCPTPAPEFGSPIDGSNQTRTVGTKYIYIKVGNIPQIADAISRANSDPSYNYVLLVPPGAYTLPAPVPPSTSTFTVTGNVVIQGVNANYDHDQSAVVTFERLTYLSLSYRMFFVAPGASLTLRDIRLKGGGGTSGIGYGGTIYNYGQLQLIDVRVTDGSAYAQGGGIYNIYPGSTVLTNVMFKDNAANIGGAISSFSGDVDIYSGGGTYCIKFKNNTGWVNGGAIYSENADTKVSKGIFTGNTSPVYRDIENSPVSPPGNVVKAKNSWWLSAPSVSLNVDTTGASIGGGEPDMNCSAATPADVPSANWSEYGLVFGATQGNDIFETLEGAKKVGLTLMFKFGGDTPWDAFKRIMYFPGRTQIRFVVLPR